MIDDSRIRRRFEALAPLLDERGRRRLAAAKVETAGHGGVQAASRIMGIARSTIGSALRELRGKASSPPSYRVRRRGFATHTSRVELELTITVSHPPLGTGKFIAATSTKAGLEARSELDTKTYPAGVKITNAQMREVHLQRHDFHGEGNRTIRFDHAAAQILPGRGFARQCE